MRRGSSRRIEVRELLESERIDREYEFTGPPDFMPAFEEEWKRIFAAAWSLVSRDGQSPSAVPAWNRLSVEGGVVTLDGEAIRVRGRAPEFLSKLIAAKGASVKADALERSLGTRPKRVYDALPRSIQVLVDRPGRGQVGYRLK